MIPPTETAESVWIWYCRVQSERWLGAKAVHGYGMDRPYDADTVRICANRMIARVKPTAFQTAVLWTYGLEQRPPDRRFEPRELQAWNLMLDHLHTELAAKDIVK